MIVYFNYFNILQKSSILIILYLFSLVIQIKNKPYLTKTLNTIASNELVSLLLIISSAMLSHVSADNITKIIASVLIVLLNIQFLAISLKIIILYNFQNLSKMKCFAFLYFITFFQKLACIVLFLLLI